MKCIHLILQFEGSVGHQYIRFNVGVLTTREIELVTQLNSIIDELGRGKELEERREKMRQMGQKLTQVIKDMANDC